MHPAPAFRETDPSTLVARLRAHPFASVSAATEGRVVTAHTPILIEDDGAMRFHLANANAVAIAIAKGASVLITTLGEHAYVDPLWYGEPDQVGTWNYVSVEAEGRPEPLVPDATLAFLHDLAATFDGDAPWTSQSMSDLKMARFLRAITAYRLVPTRFEGTTKLSQNKSPALCARIAEALGNHPVAGLMREGVSSRR